MSQTWQTRTATEKQVQFIESLIGSKDLSGLDEGVLELVADVESDVTISSGVASTLIEALKAAPRKPFAKKEFAPLVSTYPARLAKAEAAHQATEAANRAYDTAREAAGGVTTPEGHCVTCTHKHYAEQCGVMVEWRGSDYTEYYKCECTETARGTAASEEARRLEGEWTRLQHEETQAWYAAQDIEKGDRVVNARGRKIPKGTVGQVVHLVDGQWGWRALLLLDDGTKVWTAVSNLQHEEVK